MVKKIIPDIVEVKTKTGKKRDALIQPPVKIEIRTGEKSDESDAKAAFEWLSSINPTSEGRAFERIDKAEKYAKNFLIGEGFEPSVLVYPWGNVDAPPCTPSWYAIEMLKYANLLKREIEQGNLFEVIITALNLAEAQGRFEFSYYQPETLIGLEKVRDGKASGKFSVAQKNGWLIQAKALLESNVSDYLHNNGSPHYKNIAMQIVVDERRPSKEWQSIYNHLRKNKEKK